MQQALEALPCCGYTDASAVKWNPFNGVVQCHKCGQVYSQKKQTNDSQTLEAILSVVCRYLPPDGISREQAMSEIIGLVDPGPSPLPVQPAFYQPAANEAVEILKSLGYVYEPTYTGLAWVAKKSAQPEQEAEPIGKLIPCREGWFADIDNPPPTDGVYEIMSIFTLQPLSLQRQPLTKNQRLAVKTRANQAMIRNPNLAWSDALVFETEAAHHIKEGT
jgi:hypothetical protein